MQKKVSVIIPTYNRAKYLKRAINSVLNQTYKDVEIIVVDDNNANSDERAYTEQIMTEFVKYPNVIYLKHEINLNGSSARNTGIHYAHGDYITFLDDDDIFFPERISKCVLCLEKNPSYDCVYTGCVVIDNNKILNVYKPKKEGNLKKETLSLAPVIITGSNVFFTTSSIKDIGDFDVSFKRAQDVEYMVRFFDKHLITFIDEVLVIKDEESRINVPNIKMLIQNHEHFLESFDTEIKQYEDYKDIYKRIYLTLIDLIKDTKSSEYLYLKNKLLEYGYEYKRPLKIKIKFKFPKLFNFIRFFRGKIKSNMLTKDEKKFVKGVCSND